MNKKVMRLITIATVVLTIIFMSATCFATEINVNDINGKANVDVTQIGTVGNKIATILRAIGTVLLVLILMILGIKYMMGSAEEKAEYKKTMIPYLIGAVLLFGATQIAAAVLNFAK